jgi:hypothetical protein
MIIFPPELQFHENLARVSARFIADGKEDSLWFEVDKKFADYLVTDRIDAFLVGLLPLAMRLGEDIELRHPVSQRTYFNIDQNLTSIINFAFPDYKVISITPKGFAEPIPARNGRIAATGLSCGIDSLFTVIKNSSSDVPGGYKITHGIFTNVGSHGQTDAPEGMERFQGRLRNARGCAEELGLELILIDSNMEQILSGLTDYDRTLTFRNAAAVLVLERLICRYLHSSGITYEYMRVKRKGKDSAAYEPMTLPCLCTDSLEFILFGGRCSRTEKTALVADFEPSYRWLNVCAIQANNCGHCIKCMRTMLTLDILGKLDHYSQVFEMKGYEEDKYRYLAYVLTTRKIKNQHRDIAALIAKVDYHPPRKFWLYYAGYKVMFKATSAGNTVTGSIYERLDKIPLMKSSKLLSPLRFAFFRFNKIVDHQFE